ncbi:MAG: IPT/TIG domain-containing protein [Bradymonadaceae bacterium]|nr:IPT/TIG domain-containing protein [Lujinxingiaceae bacterium]
MFGLLATSTTACSDDVVPVKPGIDVTVETDTDAGPEPDSQDDVPKLPDVGKDADPVPDVVVVPDGGDDTNIPDVIEPDINVPDIATLELSIESITPARGTVDGGTAFSIRGVFFTPQTGVYFDARRVDVRLVDGKLVGETPSGSNVGPVNIKVLDPLFGQDTLVGGFTFTAPLEIASVVPNRVPTTGGVEVTVNGRGFTEDTRVSFGGQTSTRHTLINENMMRVIAPARAAGLVNVRASNTEGTFMLPSAVTYFEPMRLDTILPAAGAATGNETVVFNGGGFHPQMIVEFGSIRGTLQSVNPARTVATVITPASSVGLVDVRIQSPIGDSALAERAFYFYNSPTDLGLGAVHPNRGPASGGIEVTLIGSGLAASGLQVRFGTNDATILEQTNDRVKVRVPARAIGVVDVSVIRDGQTVTLPGAFTYVADLWVDTIAPNSGPVEGNDTVVISGEGFTGAERVLFGTLSAAFTVDNDGQITATTPAHGAAQVNVSVERGGIKATLFGGYTFAEDLVLYGYFPTRGSIAGNTYIEIRGRGFSGTPQVHFGEELGLDVRVLDAQTLSVRSPKHASGAVDLKVTQAGDSITAATRYTFFNPGARFGGSWGGPIAGAVNVTVYTYDYAPIEGAYVMLSTNAGTPYFGLTDEEGMVTLSGPDVYGEQTITAIKAGHSSATVQRINAENVTIFLFPPPPPPNPGPPPPGPPSATFQGNISGLNKIQEPGPDEFLMAIVYSTQRTAWSTNPDPGSGNIVIADGPYTVRTRVGDLALIAVGGLYNNRTQSFKPLRMGVERFLFAADSETYRVDLPLDIVLDQTVSVKFNNSPRGPSGPTTNMVMPYLDFGFEGVFGGVEFARSRDSLIDVPYHAPLTGKLADVSYFIIGGAYTDFDYAPLSEGFIRDATSIEELLEMPALPGVPSVTSPAWGAKPVNGLVSFNINSTVQPDFYWVYVENAQGATVWEAFLPGDVTSFRFPDFPSFAHLPSEERPVPYPDGQYLLVMFGVKGPDLDYNNFAYDDLYYDSWSAYSLGYTLITF